MPDDKVTFRTDLDNSELEKDLLKVTKKIENMERDIAGKRAVKTQWEISAEKLCSQLDEAKVKLDEMQNASSGTFSANTITMQEETVKSLQARWDSAQNQVEKYDRQITEATANLNQQKIYASELKDQITQTTAKLSTGGTAMQQAFDKANASAKKFKSRLASLVSGALVFNLISSGLRSVASYIGDALKYNDEFSEQLARLKGALLTAFQPIYEYILPGLVAILRVLTAIVQVVANVLSALFGKTASQSAKNAESLYKEANAISSVGSAAKEASKQLMGFDEINRLESTDTSAGGGSGTGIGAATPDFSAFDAEIYKAKIDELAAYLSGALLALGAILAFSGVNVPLGIALMAIGAVGLATVAKENWNSLKESLSGALGELIVLLSTFLLPIGAILAFSGLNIPLGIALMAAGLAGLAVTNNVSWGAMSQETRNEATEIMAILGGSLLAIGAILAFSGANIPLGLALMAVGAFSLANAASLNWNSIVNALQGPVGQVVAIGSAALLALGLILAFSGVNIPLGIALMGAGAIGLVTVGAMNWNAILEKCQEVWGSIKQWFNTSVAPMLTMEYWKEKFSNIAEGLKQKIKDGINGAGALFNTFISWINGKMRFSWGSFSAFGQEIISAGSLQLFSIDPLPLPLLAQGAVIPPNREFLAVLGDQKHGNNIEAPESAIYEQARKAVADVLSQQGGGDITINFTGDLAQLARVLYPEIHRQERNTARARGW